MLSIQIIKNRPCSTGCVKCLSNGECLLCDLYSGFARISGVCLERSVENCQHQNFNGTCRICKNGYFLDFGKCVSINHNENSNNEPIPNCIEYFTATSCQKCNLNFYLKNGQCISVKAVINNCALYNLDATKCLECAAGKVLSLDQLTCSDFEPPLNNCLSVSMVGCKECKSGYRIDVNKVTLNIF